MYNRANLQKETAHFQSCSVGLLKLILWPYDFWMQKYPSDHPTRVVGKLNSRLYNFEAKCGSHELGQLKAQMLHEVSSLCPLTLLKKKNGIIHIICSKTKVQYKLPWGVKACCLLIASKFRSVSSICCLKQNDKNVNTV